MIQSKSKLGFHFHLVSFHFTSFRFTSAHLIFISYHFISFSFLFLLHFHFPSGFICGFILFCFVSRDAENLAMTLHQKSSRVHRDYIFLQFFGKPTAQAMRKQFGSFAEAGTLISQSDRPAGEFLRFRQISAEAKSLRIRIMRKACGRRLGRFGLMFEFPAEAKPLENRI